MGSMSCQGEVRECSRKRASSSQVDSVGLESRSPLSSRRRVAQHQDSDLFVAVMADAGCILSGTDSPVLACRDSHHVQQQLEQRLRNDTLLALKFVAGLQSHVSEDDSLRRMLVPIAGSSKGSLGICDSVARVLLSVGPIQTDVANILLEKLPEIVGDGGARLSGRQPPLMETTARLILSQFRWLDYLQDSRGITEKFVQVLSVCPSGLKKEIIAFLPEVVVDQDHETLLGHLEQVLQEDSQLITAVLEAFSNLDLSDDLLEQVMALALGSLRSADVEDLPVVVRFLLQSGTGLHVKQVVQQLRNNLHFVTVSDVRSSKPDIKQKGKCAAADSEALVLDAIRTGLLFQNVFCEAFLKEIKGIGEEKNHKVVDIWMMLILHANGGPHRKAAEQLLVKKVIGNEIRHGLLRQCIQGRGDSVRDYFQTILRIGEVFLSNQETVARDFGVQTYVLLFEEFTDSYHRQQILGSLITHTGSGVEHEVGSALDALLLLAKKYPREVLPISSFINGILDFLESFGDRHLHQVYKIFSQLAVTAWSSKCSSRGSSIANELLIIIRKQITNPELRYQRMGVIGAVGLVASLARPTSGEEFPADDGVLAPNIQEAVSILQMIVETSKTSASVRSFFYDELTAQVAAGTLHVDIIEWISQHTNEFERVFLGDLDGGLILGSYPECGTLEGEIWMNLDGDVSPIILKLLPLLASDERSSGHVDGNCHQPLLFLPSNFRLLAYVESFTNNGSLGTIDALLGCPLFLPKHQLIRGDGWKTLSRRQKELSCLALYFAINWIKELLNVFSSQICGQNENVTQAIQDEISGKLHKRVRNIIFLEHLLGECLKSVPHLSFPKLHCFTENTTPSAVDRKNLIKNGLNKSRVRKAAKKVVSSKVPEDGGTTQQTKSQVTQANGKAKQPSIAEVFSKISQGQGAQNRTHVSQLDSEAAKTNPSIEAAVCEGNNGRSLFDAQKWKFRPLNMSSIVIMCTLQESELSCCPDPAAQLPLALYLLEDLHHKLESSLVQHVRRKVPWITGSGCHKAPSGLEGFAQFDVLEKLEPLFPNLRRFLDRAIHSMLSESTESEEQTKCDHWDSESVVAGNPAQSSFKPTDYATAQSIFVVVLRCLSKILSYSRLTTMKNWPVLRALLHAFATADGLDQICADMIPSPSPGSLEYSVCSTFAYLDRLSESAAKTSFSNSTELVMALKALVDCAEACLDITGDTRRRSSSTRIPALLPCLRMRLSVSAGAVLKREWGEDEQGKGWKTKADLLQQLLRIHIQNSENPVDLLEELACNIMPQVAAKGRAGVDAYPILSPTTFLIWYRVQHEEVLNIFGQVVKEIVSQNKEKASLTRGIALNLLGRIRQCVMVHVSLINLTKSHNKTPVHLIAVKCGGKFVDTFLKGMDFLRAQYQVHNDLINSLVKELQKATRIIQTLCSEAKGQKKLPVTCKVPLVKRSMERYVFCVKALLHGTSHGESFWMGNLRHKDLQGREVGSQLSKSDEENVDEDGNQDGNDEESSDGDGDGANANGDVPEDISQELRY